MKERPILFSAPLVLALLADRKTVTRRIINPQPTISPQGSLHWKGLCYGQTPDGRPALASFAKVNPYGQPGDRLWVRETWRAWALTGAGDLWRFEYQADGSTRDLYPPKEWQPPKVLGKQPLPWVPSIFMPRFACRMERELVGVRVERLHDITEEDAQAEGVDVHGAPFTVGWKNYEPEPAFESVAYHATARESFASLWRSINGPESWAANPWLRRVEFRQVPP